MSTPDRLYHLLPAVYRERDAVHGYALRDLLRVIGEQVTLLEDNIARLYDNWFIETCDDWVVPYLGELIGYTPVQQIGGLGSRSERALIRLLAPRREVANTIRYRRRRGSLALLELLAADVAGWPAGAVEFSRLLGGTQALNHQRGVPPAAVDVRAAEALELVHGPFEQAAHTVDVRRLGSRYSAGRYNPAAVGLFIWRLKACSITRATAYCEERQGPHAFRFSVLGNDIPLFTKPVAQEDPAAIAGEPHVPAPISRRRFEVRERGQRSGRASPAFYAAGRSLMIWTIPADEKAPDLEVPIEQIVPADLTDWTYRPRRGEVAVDPVLGRIAFAEGEPPEHGIRVSYHYGFSAEMGGGEYPRSLRPGLRRLPEPAAPVRKGPARPEPPIVGEARAHGLPLLYRVGRTDATHSADGLAPDYRTVDDAIEQWTRDAPDDAIVEIVDSDVYEEQVEVPLQHRSLELRGASGRRPVLRLVDRRAGRPDALTVTGSKGGALTVDGILIAGRGVEVRGPVASVVIRHSTLVPGWSIGVECEPDRPNEPSLTLRDLEGSRAPCVLLDFSIVGSLRVIQDEVRGDPVDIHVRDSVIDATRADLEAVEAAGGRLAHANLTVVRSTIIGHVGVHAIPLAENSIFDGEVRVVRRQTGCVRFCYVPPGSRTPPRFQCQPDLAAGALKGRAREDVERRVRPEFNSTRYGTPDYCQLAETCPEEISRGADDQSEMGAFHHLYQSQRRAALEARLDEYVPAGVEAGVIIAT